MNPIMINEIIGLIFLYIKNFHELSGNFKFSVYSYIL